jgi:predicted nucleotidyltransferase component of viral defense system
VISRAYLTEWRRHVPWIDDAQIEQDLILSRALTDLYSDPLVSSELAFRGGTALHKLFLSPAGRYSEDLDLVQVHAGAIGTVIDAVRARLDPWLGTPQRKQGHGRVTLVYRFSSEIPPTVRLRLKVEINTREHFTVYGLCSQPFSIDSPWHKATVQILTYTLEELLGTKLRALYQRKKGRDLYDLWMGLTRHEALDVSKVINCFHRYMDHGNHSVSKAEYIANLEEKMGDAPFTKDIFPLLSKDAVYDPSVAHRLVLDRILAHL